MTPTSMFDVPEVLLSQVVPSVEVRMVPELPTVTNNPVEVVVLSVVVELSVLLEPSSLLLQEMKVELKRNRERMMSRCFTWFPFWWIRRTQYIPELGLNYNEWVFYLGGV